MNNQDRNIILELGPKLEEEYGEGKPQDLHIQYFYLILGNEIVDRKKEILQYLNGRKGWRCLELAREWPSYIIGELQFPDRTTERDKEEILNRSIRTPLLEMFDIPPDSQKLSPIIISRVCKYSNLVVPRSKLFTKEIGERILQNPQAQDQHLDHFYLTLYVNVVKYLAKLPDILSQLPGDWKSVTPEETWPLTFIGYFPKKSCFESEREREWRLNVQVRLPLKQYFYSLIKKDVQGMLDAKTVVGVLFSRACKYKDM